MLRERLPQVGERLKAAGEARAGWLGDPTTLDVHSILSRNGEAKICCWLPSEAYAKAWAEYCKTGDVKDAATPPSPMSVKAVAGNGGVTLTWQADADFKSGVKGFAVLREGKQVAIVGSPKSNVNPEERFQAWEFGDEPTPKIPP